MHVYAFIIFKHCRSQTCLTAGRAQQAMRTPLPKPDDIYVFRWAESWCAASTSTRGSRGTQSNQPNDKRYVAIAIPAYR